MIDAYKRFSVRTHALAIAALTGLALLLGWTVNEPWLIGGAVLGTLIVLHLFMTKLNSLLALIAILVQAITFGAMLVGIRHYGEPMLAVMGVNPELAFYGFACYALTVTGLYLFVAYKLSRGRMWINLSTAFMLMWIVSLVVIAFNPLWAVTALTSGFVAGLTFLLLRIPNRRKKEPFTRPALNKTLAAQAESLFAKNDLEFVRLGKESQLKGHYLAYNEQSAFLISVVKPVEQFSVTNTGVVSDGVNLTPMLENAQDSIHLSRKDLPVGCITSVLLVLSPFQNLQAIMTVAVSKWKQPDHMLGTMNILSTKGFSRFIRATKGEMKHMKPEKRAQIKNFAEKLT